MPAIKRYGRLIWSGKGPAISAQVQAMARREQPDLGPQDIDDKYPNYVKTVSVRVQS